MGASEIFNLLIGPLGQSFKIIKERGKLFEEKDFTELTESQYALYEKKVGKPKQAIYCIGIDEETKEYEIVDEDEKEALMLGSSDCISLNVPPISLSNVPGISE